MAPATVRASTIPQRVVGIPSPVVGAPVGIRAALVDMQEVVMEGVATIKLSWPVASACSFWLDVIIFVRRLLLLRIDPGLVCLGFRMSGNPGLPIWRPSADRRILWQSCTP